MALLGNNTTGGITPSDLRAAITELYNRTYTVSVKEFGAFGDGQSHTLASLGYTTLAAAQAKYPSAKALTDEADWAAHQSAVDSIRGTGVGQGGIVFTPAGRYRFNRSLRFPWHHWGTSGSGAVSWIGEGSRASIIELRNDFQETAKYYSLAGGDSGRTVNLGDPNGQFCVASMERVDPDFHTSLMDVLFCGLGFVGPGTWASSWPLGSTNGYTTKGVITTDRVKFREIWISGFYAGLAVDGGQTVYRDVDIDNCYYGIYFHWRNVFNHGDARFWNVNISNCKAACVGSDDTVGHFHSYSWCNFKNTPYFFVKEPGSGLEEWNYPGTDSATAKTSVHRAATFKTAPMTHCIFENIGNTIFQDGMETYSGGVIEVNMSNCVFRNVGAGAGGPSLPAQGAMRNQGTFHNYMFRNIHLFQPKFENTRPTGAAFCNTTRTVLNIQMENIDPVIQACETANKPLFNLTDLPGTIRLIGATWSGTMMGATGTIPRYSLVTVGGDAKAAVASVATRDIIGVNQQTAVSNVIPIAQKGSTLVRCTSQPSAVGVLLRLDTANPGRVVQASSAADGYVVGYCTDIGSGGLCTMYLTA